MRPRFVRSMATAGRSRPNWLIRFWRLWLGVFIAHACLSGWSLWTWASVQNGVPHYSGPWEEFLGNVVAYLWLPPMLVFGDLGLTGMLGERAGMNVLLLLNSAVQSVVIVGLVVAFWRSRSTRQPDSGEPSRFM